MRRLWSEARVRLGAWLWPGHVRERIDEELRFHLDMQEKDLRRRGHTIGDARQRALELFGDPDRVRRAAHAEYLLPTGRKYRKGFGDMVLQDFRFAARSLRQRPVFAVIAISTLALGIAAVTTIFTLVDGAVLRPLPFVEPDRLVVPSSTHPPRGLSGLSIAYPEYLEWASHSEVFEHLALVSNANVDLTGEGEPERIPGALVSADYFRIFRVDPLMGRTFAVEDYADGGAAVVVLSRGLWQRRFGGAEDILGAEVRLSGRPYTVVGVVDEASVWPSTAEAWAPFSLGDPVPDYALRWDNFFLRAIGRLQPGVPVARADALARGIADRVAREMPAIRDGYGAEVVTLQDWIVEPDVRTILYVLLGAVTFVLLLVCVNIGNLLLARAAERDREIAVRRALGAGRAALLRQMFIESLTFSSIGAGLGLLLSVWGVDVLATQVPNEVVAANLSIDPTVTAFAVFLALATATFFSLVPALYFGKASPRGALQEAGRTTSGGRASQRLRSALIVAEITLSLVLLSASGLLIRGVAAMFDNDPGLHAENLLVMRVAVPSARYPQRDLIDRFYLGVTEDLAALPGVESAAAAMSLPLAGGGLFRVHLEEGAPEPPAGPEYDAQWQVVTPGYFRTLGIPILAGRDFDSSDRADSEPVIVVSDSFARDMFPGQSPLGKRIRSWRDENLYRTIVGVVGDVRQGGLDTEFNNLVYVSRLQTTITPSVIFVRTTEEPLRVLDAARAAVWNRDPDLPIANVSTMEQVAADSIDGAVLISRLMGLLGMLSMAIAALGLYGLMAYAVAQRAHEFGVRVALGAASRDVLAAVLGRALGLAAIGVLIGLGGAVGIGRIIASALPIDGADPVTFVAVSILLLAVTLLASFVPARRATRVDPVRVLRRG